MHLQPNMQQFNWSNLHSTQATSSLNFKLKRQRAVFKRMGSWPCKTLTRSLWLSAAKLCNSGLQFISNYTGSICFLLSPRHSKLAKVIAINSMELTVQGLWPLIIAKVNPPEPALNATAFSKTWSAFSSIRLSHVVLPNMADLYTAPPYPVHLQMSSGITSKAGKKTGISTTIPCPS